MEFNENSTKNVILPNYRVFFEKMVDNKNLKNVLSPKKLILPTIILVKLKCCKRNTLFTNFPSIFHINT